MNDEGVRLLADVDLFAGVDPKTLGQLFEAGRVLRSRPGDLIIRQGAYGDSFYVLLDGEARVEVVGADGRVARKIPVRRGGYFGELALLGRGERKASVRATKACQLLELRKVHFDRGLKRHKQVKQRLQGIYTQNAIRSFVSRGRYFRNLDPDSAQALADTATIRSFHKDDVIIQEGAPAQALYIIRSGFVRVSRRVSGDGADEVLAYLGSEDFFGDEEAARSAPYGATAVAVEPVECIEVPRATVWTIYLRQPELLSEFRRYSSARSEQQAGILGSKTSMGFVRDMLDAGLGQARSALIIDMDVCVRCGNCVQACDDLHGFSRLARRGKKLTRRRSASSARRQNLFFPTSCLQCATPECMVGCPTGAIARDVGGEVYVKDTCIGCGNCARNCDFGNISMAQMPEPSVDLVGMVKDRSAAPPPKKKADLVAVKCDVCFEREFAACVYNCPVEAVLRIDPRTYFEELQGIAPKLALEQGVATSHKLTQSPRKSRVGHAALQGIVLVVGVLAAFVLAHRFQPNGWRGAGMYAGIAAALTMVLLALIGARKRLRTHRLGSLSSWARVHSLLGGALYGLVLFHCDFQATSLLTAILLFFITISVAVGFGGQVASILIPTLLARSEDEALLPEDVGPRITALESATASILEPLDGERAQAIEAQAKLLVQSGWKYFTLGIGSAKLEAHLSKRGQRMTPLAGVDQATALRVAANLAQVRTLVIRRAFEVLLTSWVPVHLVSSIMAMVILLGHVATVFLW